MNITIAESWRERAVAMIAEVGFVVGEEPRDHHEAVKAYWSCHEGAEHFEEPKILRYCVASYTGSVDDEVARLAAVLLLREEAERHQWGFQKTGPPVGMDGEERLLVVHVSKAAADEDLPELGRKFAADFPRLVALASSHEDRGELHVEAHPGGLGGCPVCRFEDGPLWSVDPTGDRTSEYKMSDRQGRIGKLELGPSSARGAVDTQQNCS